jgi:hypothetical protein
MLMGSHLVVFVNGKQGNVFLPILDRVIHNVHFGSVLVAGTSSFH